MKRIGITQRVEVVPTYGERRDCLDQRWTQLALELDLLPVPLPNLLGRKTPDVLDSLELDAIVLSGGNSIGVQGYTGGDVAVERDEHESALLTFALSRKIPTLGVCRGLQMINAYFGGNLSPVDGHVATRHPLQVPAGAPDHDLLRSVNSYHNLAIARADLAEVLIPLALDHQGNVEALRHKDARLFGIMWHPEREDPFDSSDLSLLQSILL